MTTTISPGTTPQFLISFLSFSHASIKRFSFLVVLLAVQEGDVVNTVRLCHGCCHAGLLGGATKNQGPHQCSVTLFPSTRCHHCQTAAAFPQIAPVSFHLLTPRNNGGYVIRILKKKNKLNEEKMLKIKGYTFYTSNREWGGGLRALPLHRFPPQTSLPL